MDLKTKFNTVNACRTVGIRTLELNRPYAIVRAEHATTKFGATIVVYLTWSPTETVKVFLPRRYATLFTDVDIGNINEGVTLLCLVYNGTCPQTQGFNLTIQPL